jgi:hypothetical protein
MRRHRFGAWISAAMVGCCVLACSPVSGAVSSSSSPNPSLPALRSADPTIAVQSPDDAPAELRVGCDGTTTRIPTPRARARPDGFHIRFANPTGRALQFGIDDASGLPMLGNEVPVEGGTFINALGTGVYHLGCGGPPTAFAVVDPDGVYTPTELGCGNASGTTGTVDYGQEARGPKGSLLDVARTELRGLEAGDLVERAGYPASDGDQLVRVVRAGRVVAVLGYADDGHGGWLIGMTRTCPGSNVTVGAPEA